MLQQPDGDTEFIFNCSLTSQGQRSGNYLQFKQKKWKSSGDFSSGVDSGFLFFFCLFTLAFKFKIFHLNSSQFLNVLLVKYLHMNMFDVRLYICGSNLCNMARTSCKMISGHQFSALTPVRPQWLHHGPSHIWRRWSCAGDVYSWWVCVRQVMKRVTELVRNWKLHLRRDNRLFSFCQQRKHTLQPETKLC